MNLAVFKKVLSKKTQMLFYKGKHWPLRCFPIIPKDFGFHTAGPDFA